MSMSSDKPCRDEQYTDEELDKVGIDRDRFKELMGASKEFCKYLQRLRSMRSNVFHCEACNANIRCVNNRVRSHMLSKKHLTFQKLYDELRAEAKN